MIVADTNVVSELMRREPDAAVVAWSETMARHDVGITAITVEEIERGIGRVAPGHRRDDLARRWQLVVDGHADRVLPYDEIAARQTARLLVKAQSSGRIIGLADAEIAGICLARAADLATRNLKDFRDIDGLTVLNPWQS
ncbi:type II toxin-antitoxin system VapC family toxin [Tersicoccus sp. MR15.9]|uniref:type II toxin-antitoxin system VapC family toxin n=1 Tax=Tersicoccus mangrovi TaxID=3121635 RepID=UPI002FE64E80